MPRINIIYVWEIANIYLTCTRDMSEICLHQLPYSSPRPNIVASYTCCCCCTLAELNLQLVFHCITGVAGSDLGSYCGTCRLSKTTTLLSSRKCTWPYPTVRPSAPSPWQLSCTLQRPGCRERICIWCDYFLFLLLLCIQLLMLMWRLQYSPRILLRTMTIGRLGLDFSKKGEAPAPLFQP